ncbi:peptidase family M48-domain-containing protein [Syncephalis plumigaleata]|nr:peptidase family M48-domain-containing protein [Syncephalis plumigaleata]
MLLTHLRGCTRVYGDLPARLSVHYRYEMNLNSITRFTMKLPTRHSSIQHSMSKRSINYGSNPLGRPSTSEYKRFKQRPSASNSTLRRQLPLLLGGGALGIGGYYVTHLETVPMTGRRRFMSMSPENEEKLAKISYNGVMQEFGRNILPPSHPITVFVRRVAERIIQASGMTDLNWEVFVIDSPIPNAFVLPGGKVFVFTGILPMTQDEQGMAAVLGHEIAHQVARHTAEKVSFTKLIIMFQLFLSLFIDPNLVFNQFFQQVGIMLPFSRKCEREADQIGMQLMAQACYEPSAAIAMWHRMNQKQKVQPIQYISTHPSHESRIKYLEKWLPEAQVTLANSDCHAELSNLADAFHRAWARW